MTSTSIGLSENPSPILKFTILQKECYGKLHDSHVKGLPLHFQNFWKSIHIPTFHKYFIYQLSSAVKSGWNGPKNRSSEFFKFRQFTSHIGPSLSSTSLIDARSTLLKMKSIFERYKILEKSIIKLEIRNQQELLNKYDQIEKKTSHAVNTAGKCPASSDCYLIWHLLFWFNLKKISANQ